MIDLKERINNRLGDNESRERKENTLYVSEIGNCIRKIFFRYNFPTSVDTQTQKFFRRGDITHEDVTDLLKEEEDLVVKDEVPVTLYLRDSGFRLSGRVDDVIYEEDGGKYLVEKKTTGDVSKTKKYGASKHHKIQLMLYLGAMGYEKGMLFYIDNDYNMYQENIDFDREFFHWCLDRAENVAEHIKDDKIPMAEAKESDEGWLGWMCNYCDYSDTCNKLPNQKTDASEHDLEKMLKED